MIPKKIHYCWFGRNELPKKAKYCVESWKKYCPDYEIIEWNEDNFDINMNAYTQMCYEQKKYAFLSDYVRLLVIEEHGGIYFDTDVEVLRTFDDLLEYNAFFCFENDSYVASGLGFGAEAHQSVVQAMIEEYRSFLDGKHGVQACPHLNTEALVKLGLKLNGKEQEICGAKIFPKEYFNPYEDSTGRLIKTENTYSIHWYFKSALSKKQILRSNITRPFHRIFGNDCFGWLKK